MEWVASRYFGKTPALFQVLYQHDNAEVGAWARNQYTAIQEIIKAERVWEKGRNRERNESFE
jgi:hypothetical protein